MNPEYNRERKESYFEKRRLNESMAHDLLQALETGRDSMPDIVSCPVSSCRNPLNVRFLDDHVEVVCPNCGFRNELKQNGSDD